MDSLFQKISAHLSSDDKATSLIIGCFLCIACSNLILGFAPWYMLIATIPMFFSALLRPKAGLYAIIVLTILFERFFTLESFQFGRDILKLYPLDIVLFGIYGSVLAQSMLGKRSLSWNKVDIPFLLFFALASAYFLISLMGFNQEEMSVAFSTWKNYVFYGALFFILPRLLQHEADLRKGIRYFIVTAILAIMFLFIGMARGEGLWTEYTPLSTDGVRLLAFPHAFYFSLAFLGMFVATKYWYRYSDRHVAWTVMSLWGIGIVASLMRHMWVGLAFVSVMACVFLMDRAGRFLVGRMAGISLSLGASVIIGGLLFSLVLPNNQVGNSFQSLAESVTMRVTSISDTKDESISWRGSTWASAWDVLSKNPIFGLGFGRHVAVESGEYHDFIEIRNIHNSWLALLVQMGFIGFFTFFFAVIFLVSILYRLSIASEFLALLRNVCIAVIGYFSIVFLAQPYLEANMMSIFFWLTLGVLRTIIDQACTNPTRNTREEIKL